MMKPARVVLALAAFALMASCRDDDAVPVPAAGGAPATAASAQPLDWAVGGTWRLDSVKARDTWRHPVTTLSFFGLKPTDTVVEIWPDKDYWTAILDP